MIMTIIGQKNVHKITKLELALFCDNFSWYFWSGDLFQPIGCKAGNQILKAMSGHVVKIGTILNLYL